MFVSTFNKWTRFVGDDDATEKNLTMIFGFAGYCELLFAILPGIIMDVCAKSKSPYIDRRIGAAIGLAGSVAFALINNIFWGKAGCMGCAITSIVSYYAFRSFFFGSLQASVAVLFPVRLIS